MSIRKILFIAVACIGLGGCVATVTPGPNGRHYQRHVTRWCHNGVCTRHVYYHYWNN